MKIYLIYYWFISYNLLLLIAERLRPGGSSSQLSGSVSVCFVILGVLVLY